MYNDHQTMKPQKPLQDAPVTIYAYMPIVSDVTGIQTGKRFLCNPNEAWSMRERKGFQWADKQACLKDKRA
jgi:hypothetical protein